MAKPEVADKPIWIRGDIIAKAQAEADRLQKAGQTNATERKVIEYWMRLGARTEPQIQGILT